MTMSLNDADRLEVYLNLKRHLLAAAVAYAESPSEGQAYALRVAARAFAKARRKTRIDTPIQEEP